MMAGVVAFSAHGVGPELLEHPSSVLPAGKLLIQGVLGNNDHSNIFFAIWALW